MKKIVISIATASILTVSFTGCAGSDLSVSSPFAKESVKEFKTGTVTKTVKVLINDRKIAALTGAGIGGVGGAIVANKNGKTLQSTVGGAIVGGLIGGLVGKEVEAFKTTIDNKYTAYVSKQLSNGTKVEFVIDGKEIKNVNVLKDVNNDTLVDAIDKRYKKAGLWNYHLSKYDITIKSKKKYYFLNDLVNVTFDSNYMITNIKKLRSGVINKKPKIVTKTIYKTKVVEKPIEVEKVIYKDRVVEKVVKKPPVEQEQENVTTNGFWR